MTHEPIKSLEGHNEVLGWINEDTYEDRVGVHPQPSPTGRRFHPPVYQELPRPRDPECLKCQPANPFKVPSKWHVIGADYGEAEKRVVGAIGHISASQSGKTAALLLSLPP